MLPVLRQQYITWCLISVCREVRTLKHQVLFSCTHASNIGVCSLRRQRTQPTNRHEGWQLTISTHSPCIFASSFSLNQSTRRT